MKKYLLIALILCIPIAAFAWGILGISGGTAPAGDSCDTLTGDANDGSSVGSFSVGQFSGAVWMGTSFSASDTGTYTVCAIELNISINAGSTNEDFTAVIYTESAGEPAASVGTACDAVDVASLPG